MTYNQTMSKVSYKRKTSYAFTIEYTFMNNGKPDTRCSVQYGKDEIDAMQTFYKSILVDFTFASIIKKNSF